MMRCDDDIIKKLPPTVDLLLISFCLGLFIYVELPCCKFYLPKHHYDPQGGAGGVLTLCTECSKTQDTNYKKGGVAIVEIPWNQLTSVVCSYIYICVYVYICIYI
jgi:hypothetical protein